MRIYEIISKKRQGQKLSDKDIEYFIKGYVGGEIPDYKASALLMAIAINSMDEEECISLTKWMINSGKTLDLSPIKGIKADKHSTGGVGDKTTLIVGPIVASLGIPVAKMSGRGLGHTGGTIDKLESIPAFRTDYDIEGFFKLVRDANIAIVGQSEDLVIADKLLYALRDQTATVDSIPLIASSIMSKKLASGNDVIVLDVKYGKGAFMKSKEEAKTLGDLMVSIGEGMGKKTAALLSDMNKPLGYAVGNSLEVIEAIELLKGNFNKDLYDLSIELASLMVSLAKDISIEKARQLCEEEVKSFRALNKLKEMIRNQGADDRIAEDYSLFKQAKYLLEYKAQESGIIKEIDPLKIGIAANYLGAGRKKLGDKIDYSAGILLKKQVEDSILKGEQLALLYTDIEDISEARRLLDEAWMINKR